MNIDMKKKSEIMEEAFCESNAICEAMLQVKPDKTIAAINRIARYDKNPTFRDIELGREEICKIAISNLNKSVSKINYISSEIKRTKHANIIQPVKNEDGSYKSVKDMTLSEKLNIFDQYRKLDWMIKAAHDEFAEKEA